MPESTVTLVIKRLLHDIDGSVGTPGIYYETGHRVFPKDIANKFVETFGAAVAIIETEKKETQLSEEE